MQSVRSHPSFLPCPLSHARTGRYYIVSDKVSNYYGINQVLLYIDTIQNRKGRRVSLVLVHNTQFLIPSRLQSKKIFNFLVIWTQIKQPSCQLQKIVEPHFQQRKNKYGHIPDVKVLIWDWKQGSPAFGNANGRMRRTRREQGKGVALMRVESLKILVLFNQGLGLASIVPFYYYYYI